MARLSGLSRRASIFGSILALAPAVCCRAGSLFPPSAFSDKEAGTTAASFLKTPPGARAEGLAGTFAGAADSSEAIFWNPAGLARLSESGKPDMSFSYNAMLETAYTSALAYARPLPGRGVIGGGLLYFSQGAIQGYGKLGDPSSSFTPNDLAAVLSYAGSIRGCLLGASVKLIRSQISDVSGTSFAVDLGVQSKGALDTQEGPVDFGASIRNFGPPLQLGSASAPLPFKFQGGTDWHLSSHVSFLFDGHLAVDQDPYVSIGIEGHLRPAEDVRLDLRGGYNVGNARGLDGLVGMAAGFGIDIKRFRLDYAWVPFGDLGATHRITAGLRF